MQNNAAVLPAQSDADVACTRTRIWAGTNDVEQMVKLRHIYHSAPDGYFASAATRVKKGPSRQTSMSFAHWFNIFRGGTQCRYPRLLLHIYMKRETLLRQRENVHIFRRIIRLAFVRSNFNSYNRKSLVDSCSSLAGSARMKAKLMIKRRYISLQRRLFLCLISPVAAA